MVLLPLLAVRRVGMTLGKGFFFLSREKVICAVGRWWCGFLSLLVKQLSVPADCRVYVNQKPGRV